jgi:Rod binding domain-containing protein
MRAIEMAQGNASAEASTLPPRLIKAAHEFEAQMMKELLKPMTTGDSFLLKDGGADDGGILGEFSVEALSQALSERGGLGISRRILDDVVRRLNLKGTGEEGSSL